MKKITAFIMIAALITASFVITAAAAENEWDVYASFGAYKDESEYESENDRPKEPGLRYTENGVQMYSATHDQLEAMSVNAYGGLQLKEKVDLTDGFSMTAVIDKYTDNASTDKWIAFCIWTKPKATPGNTSNGEGWLCLCRPTATNVKIQSFVNFSSLTAEPIVDTNIYEGDALVLDVKKVDGKLKIFVNDQDMKAESALNKLDNNEAYISVVLHQGNRDELAVTITDVNGVKPTGTESKEPFVSSDAKPRVEGPAVEKNNPCWLFTSEDVKKGKPGSGMESTVNDDGSLHITFTGDNYSQLDLKVKNYLYDAQEFPVWAIKYTELDNIISYSSLFYCAGEVLAAQDDSVTTIEWANSDYEDEDGWKILVLDLSEENTWKGNINSFRFDITSAADIAGAEFDLAWIGFFRSEEEAYRYAGFGDLYDRYYNTTAAETTEAEDTAETTAEETKPDDTTAYPGGDIPEAENTTDGGAVTTTGTQSKGGLPTGAMIGIIIGAVVAVAAVIAAAVLIKKKKRNQ